MKSKPAIILIIVALFGAAAFAASSSVNYKISSDVLDSGAKAGTSTSYNVLGKTRGHQIAVLAGASVSIASGFLKGAYFTGKITPTLAPVVTTITPNIGLNTGEVIISDLSGANFQNGASVKLVKSGQPDIAGTNVVVISGAKITCAFNIAGKTTGLWDVVATNPDNQSGTLPSAFTIAYPAPAITSITPSKGLNNETVAITNLAGSNFRSGAQVKLSKTGESDMIGSNIAVESSSKITCHFALTGKTVGLWDVIAVNDDSQSATLASAFKIEAPSIQVIGDVVSSKNPFNPAVGATSLNYILSKDADITLYIYNVRGERVWQRTYPSGSSGGQAGSNDISWDGMTDFKSVVSFGVYFLDVTTKVDGELKSLGRTKIAIIK